MVKKISKVVTVTSDLQKKMDDIGDLVSGYVAKERMENSTEDDFVDSDTIRPRGRIY